jgi:hypothetical protein
VRPARSARPRTHATSAPSSSPLESALHSLAAVLAPLVAAEIASHRGEDWIDQDDSALGRREHCRRARRGDLPARKVGRRWLVRRAHLDAWIEAHPTATPRAGSEERSGETVAEVLREVGLDLVARR